MGLEMSVVSLVFRGLSSESCESERMKKTN